MTIKISHSVMALAAVGALVGMPMLSGVALAGNKHVDEAVEHARGAASHGNGKRSRGKSPRRHRKPRIRDRNRLQREHADGPGSGLENPANVDLQPRFLERPNESTTLVVSKRATAASSRGWAILQP